MTNSDAPASSVKTPSVIFLHGYCEGKWIWDQVIENLEVKIPCLALDLPGFGGGTMLPEKVSIEAVAELIWRELRRQQISEVILVGHSLGGYVALAMAESQPGQVRGLGLVHSTPFADSNEKKENRNKVRTFVAQHGSRLFLDQFAPGLFYDTSGAMAAEFRKKIEDSSTDAITFYALAMRDRPDRSYLLRKPSFPAMAICGKFDQLLPADLCRQIDGMGSHAETHQLDFSAHAGMLEEPVRTAEIIQKFIKKCLL